MRVLVINGSPRKNGNVARMLHSVSDNIDKAGEIIRESSLLPSVCGRVCPQERQCEGKCVLGLKGLPVAIGALERYVGDNTNAKK